MSGLRVYLLGRFCVQRGEQILAGFEARKVQELLSYLLLHRGHPQSREALAGLLWGDSSNEQSRKYLRQALWQLQMALASPDDPINSQTLLVEPDWLDLDPRSEIWVDVACLEEAYALVEGVPLHSLEAQRVRTLREAVQLYQGDLLEGWYMEWCLYERQRFQTLFLALLHKLMGYCEVHQEYDTGIAYGLRILGYDRASERAHRRLMRLQYLAGDRTAALRQYERCVAALEEELGARASGRTQMLYHQILADQYDRSPHLSEETRATPEPAIALSSEFLGWLNQLVKALTDLQNQVQQHFPAADLTSKRPR